MKKQRKSYSRPKNLFDKSRIDSDKELVRVYGLKNRTEIWKAGSKVNRIRTEAKKLIIEPEKQELFFKTLVNKGLIKSSEASIDHVLGLQKESLLDRRLQTFVFKLGFAKTIKEARQLITHKKIKVSDRIVTIPSYHVNAKEEKLISLTKPIKVKKTEKSVLSPEKELNISNDAEEPQEKND